MTEDMKKRKLTKKEVAKMFPGIQDGMLHLAFSLDEALFLMDVLNEVSVASDDVAHKSTIHNCRYLYSLISDALKIEKVPKSEIH